MLRRLAIFPVLLLLAAAAYAQKPASTPPTATTATSAATDTDSRQTREELRTILERMPPQVSTVLRLDPALFINQQYLSTYPALASFVAAHPEVPHNPDFY